jgi:hypothetical protein
MSANSYLERLATEGVIRQLEKVNIDKSLGILRDKIDLHFERSASNAAGIKDHFVFGSYTRGTILPRKMDAHSDVDYMIVFDDSDLKPQSCLDRLKRFAIKKYRTSQIEQSHPTVILALNHIRFELVPAIQTFWGIEIPTKASLFSNWTSTSPNEFNKALTEKNKNNDDLIKPLSRLVKYWNACNSYPFESFDLENIVVNHWTLKTIFGRPNLWIRFRDFMNELSGLATMRTKMQTEAVARAQKIIAQVTEFEQQEQFQSAERALMRLLPEV